MRRILATLLFCSVTLHAEPDFHAVNTTLGVDLFADDNLWDDPAAEAAKRVNLPTESETPFSSSYRAYTAESVRLLGARPYSVALYGLSGTSSMVSVIFANKGDYGGLFEIHRQLQENPSGRNRTNLNREERKSVQGMDKAIAEDARTVEAALTGLFGKGSADRFGQGRGMRENVTRWDWRGHTFLLSSQDGNFTGVRIVPKAVADNDGRNARVSDTELKQELAQRVERRPNGDVVLSQMPMVDQGPKGFCVPATMERCLRYLGIQSDMYVLALAANTGVGGGTSMKEIEDAVAPLLRANNRRMDSLPPTLKMNLVQKYVDEGVPIIWAMFVDPEFDKTLTYRAEQRAKNTDWKAWEVLLKNAKKIKPKIVPATAAGHVCLIIGYNEKTDEIAISDSWGPEFAERWLTLDEADAISARVLRAITW